MTFQSGEGWKVRVQRVGGLETTGPQGIVGTLWALCKPQPQFSYSEWQ